VTPYPTACSPAVVPVADGPEHRRRPGSMLLGSL